jgi:anti-sigma regulatory factor (Ser/Thr protein kinase)
MEVREHRVLAVTEPSQAGDARRVARDVAEDIGLDATEAGKVALVVTEMATNLVKHARDGRILLGTVQDGEAACLLAVALDRGPGIGDLARCLDDGFSTAGSPGTGLGAIRRLSTLFDIYSGAGGTVLVAGVGGTVCRADGRLQLGGLCVPMPGEEVAGDGWAVV